MANIVAMLFFNVQSVPHEIFMWDLETGERLYTFPGQIAERTTTLTLSKDNSLLFSTSVHNEMQIWDVAKRTVLFEIENIDPQHVVVKNTLFGFDALSRSPIKLEFVFPK